MRIIKSSVLLFSYFTFQRWWGTSLVLLNDHFAYVACLRRFSISCSPAEKPRSVRKGWWQHLCASASLCLRNKWAVGSQPHCKKLRKQERSDSTGILNFHFQHSLQVVCIKVPTGGVHRVNAGTSVFGTYLTEVKGHCTKLNNPNAYFKLYSALKRRVVRCCLVQKVYFLRKNDHKKLRRWHWKGHWIL